MKSTKRKIVALSTAFVMAFALVAAMLPATVSEAATVSQISIVLGSPEVGSQLTEESKPNIVSSSGVDLEHSFMVPIKGLPSEDPTYDDPSFLPVTVTEGEFYYYELYLSPGEGNEFDVDDEDLTNVTDNVELTVSGVEDYEVSDFVSKDQYPIFVKVKATASGGGDQGGGDQGGGESTNTDTNTNTNTDATTANNAASTSGIVTLTNGASATIAQADDGTVSFRYEKDFSYFQNGGKLYIDGQEVPSDQYTARQGSTIITLLKSFASKLLDGKEHSVKVVFNDGETVESKITITPNTSTKVAAPKTADAIPFAAIAVVFVGASVAVVTLVATRKNK